jgi:hypothetical protein
MVSVNRYIFLCRNIAHTCTCISDFYLSIDGPHIEVSLTAAQPKQAHLFQSIKWHDMGNWSAFSRK